MLPALESRASEWFCGCSPVLRDRLIDRRRQTLLRRRWLRRAHSPPQAIHYVPVAAPDLPVEKVLVVRRVGDAIQGLQMQDVRDSVALGVILGGADVVVEPIRWALSTHYLYVPSAYRQPHRLATHTAVTWSAQPSPRTGIDLKEYDIYWLYADVVVNRHSSVSGPLSTRGPP